METRIVTGITRHGDGTLRPRVQVLFTMERFSFDAESTTPVDDVEAETDGDGAFSVTLAAGLATRWIYLCPGTPSFSFVLPPGPPVSIEALRAVSGIPVPLTNDMQVALDAGFLQFANQLQAIANTTVGKSAYELAGGDDEWDDEATWLASLHGADGPAPTLTIGEVSEGDDADATITEVAEGAYALGLILPRGADSTIPGPPNSLSIGTVSEGPADATITGEAPSQTLGLVLPRGNPGEGVPTGGSAGQVLVKTGAGDYATGWGRRTPPTLLGLTHIPKSGGGQYRDINTSDHGFGYRGSSNNCVIPANTLVITFVHLPCPLRLRVLRIPVQTASASGSVRATLWTLPDLDTLSELTKLAEVGTISTATTGIKNILFPNNHLPAGVVGVGLLADEQYTSDGYLPVYGLEQHNTGRMWTALSREQAYGDAPPSLIFYSSFVTSDGSGPLITLSVERIP